MIVPREKVWVVWDNPSIVCSEMANFICPAVVWSSVYWVAIASHDCFCLKRLWKTFTAFSVFHARRITLPLSTGAVHHTTLDNVEKAWFGFRDGPCRSDDGVDLFCSGGTEAGSKGKKEVHVGKATFLEFDGMNITLSIAKNVVLYKIVDQRLLVHAKDADCEVGTICSRLGRK